MCETCGASFNSQAELVNHGQAHMRAERYNCDGCGAVFRSQPELAEHVAKRHQMVTH